MSRGQLTLFMLYSHEPETVPIINLAQEQMPLSTDLNMKFASIVSILIFKNIKISCSSELSMKKRCITLAHMNNRNKQKQSTLFNAMFTNKMLHFRNVNILC